MLRHRMCSMMCIFITLSVFSAIEGSSVIDWLIKWHFAESRREAKRLAKILLSQAHFVILPGRTSKSCDDASAMKEFYDSEDIYYRFVCS